MKNKIVCLVVYKIGLGKETNKCESEEGDMEEESSIIHVKVSTGHSTYTGLQGLWTSGCISCRYTSAAVIHT